MTTESPDEALRLAQEFVANPDERAKVKVRFAMLGYQRVADMIDEAVIVSRAYLALRSEVETLRGKRER